MSPAYPADQVTPPKDRKLLGLYLYPHTTLFTTDTESHLCSTVLGRPEFHDDDGNPAWPDNWMSRPRNCRVNALDLSIVSVFHFGWHNRAVPGSWIYNNAHYYPPLLLEDRIDQLALPLLEGLAGRDGRSAVPDLVSITAGFWDT